MKKYKRKLKISGQFERWKKEGGETEGHKREKGS
jgi:hypothetical protein